jgi:hypothetical protein
MYRFNFTLHVIEDGRDQVRQYMLILEERTGGKLRALTRIPVRERAETTYIETGVKCDAQYQEVEGRVRIEVETHFSDAATAVPSDTPTIYEWQSRVELSLVPNETTLLSTYDGGGNNRRYTLEVLAEKLR